VGQTIGLRRLPLPAVKLYSTVFLTGHTQLEYYTRIRRAPF
jgi:hypothetical protein